MNITAPTVVGGCGRCTTMFDRRQGAANVQDRGSPNVDVWNINYMSVSECGGAGRESRRHRIHRRHAGGRPIVDAGSALVLGHSAGGHLYGDS